MKSQPDITIRRIAVFTGYGYGDGDHDSEPAFTRPIRRPVRPVAVSPVIRLTAVPALSVADLPRAA